MSKISSIFESIFIFILQFIIMLLIGIFLIMLVLFIIPIILFECMCEYISNFFTYIAEKCDYIIMHLFIDNFNNFSKYLTEVSERLKSNKNNDN